MKKRIETIIIGIVVVTFLLFIIPASRGLDLWEYTDQTFGPGASDYLNYFFASIGIVALIYAIFRTVISAKNTFNDFKNNKKG